jgi:hypothetical protein
MPKFTIWEERKSGAAAMAEGHAAGGKLQRKARNLDGLARLVSEYIPPEIFAGERERVYSPWVTFVAFLGQVLTRGSACRESVRRVQSWCVADRLPLPDENTRGPIRGQTLWFVVDRGFRSGRGSGCLFQRPILRLTLCSAPNLRFSPASNWSLSSATSRRRPGRSSTVPIFHLESNLLDFSRDTASRRPRHPASPPPSVPRFRDRRVKAGVPEMSGGGLHLYELAVHAWCVMSNHHHIRTVIAPAGRRRRGPPCFVSSGSAVWAWILRCRRSSARRYLRRFATARPAPNAGAPNWGECTPQPCHKLADEDCLGFTSGIRRRFCPQANRS